MAYEQVKNIVHDLARKHLAASDACRGEHGITNANARKKLLLEHLEAFEVEVYARLEIDNEATPNEILETWIQYVPMESVDDSLKRLEYAEGADKPQRLLDFHQSVTDLLKTISDQVESEEVSEFFESLTEIEETFSRQCAVAQTGEADI